MAEAYCAKCKKKQQMENPRSAMLTVQGECPDCGADVSRIRAWGVTFVIGAAGLVAAAVFLVLGITLAAFLCAVWGVVAIARGILIRTEEKALWSGDLDLRRVDVESKYALREREFLERWTALRLGETLRIITDRDPRSLYDRLKDQYRDQFEWEYERGGPDDWVVSVKKR
ncbi:MAG: DUF2249 domain-containing protein [Dehalococcoidia bacterium]